MQVWVVQRDTTAADVLLGTAEVSLAALPRLGEVWGWYDVLDAR